MNNIELAELLRGTADKLVEMENKKNDKAFEMAKAVSSFDKPFFKIDNDKIRIYTKDENDKIRVYTKDNEISTEENDKFIKENEEALEKFIEDDKNKLDNLLNDFNNTKLRVTTTFDGTLKEIYDYLVALDYLASILDEKYDDNSRIKDNARRIIQTIYCNIRDLLKINKWK